MIFLLVLAFTIADAIFNNWRIKHTAKLNHYWNGVYRTAFYGSLVWLYGMDFKHALMFLLGSFFLHSLLFNLSLNYLRKKPLDYLGKDSVLDRFEAKLPWIVWFVWKLIFISGFVYGYFNADLL